MAYRAIMFLRDVSSQPASGNSGFGHQFVAIVYAASNGPVSVSRRSSQTPEPVIQLWQYLNSAVFIQADISAARLDQSKSCQNRSSHCWQCSHR